MVVLSKKKKIIQLHPCVFIPWGSIKYNWLPVPTLASLSKAPAQVIAFIKRCIWILFHFKGLTLGPYGALQPLWVPPSLQAPQLCLPSSSSFTVLASLSASSFSFFSSSLECFSSALAPAPILQLFSARGPSARHPSGKKKKLGVGLTVVLPLFHRRRRVRGRWTSCLQRTLDSGGVFSCLTRGFWASFAHLTDQSQ